MTELEITLAIILGAIVYLIIGIGSYKIQESRVNNLSMFWEVLFWPIDLIFAAILL